MSNSRPSSTESGSGGQIPYVQIAVMIFELVTLLTAVFFMSGIAADEEHGGFGSNVGSPQQDVPDLVVTSPVLRIWGDMEVHYRTYVRDGTSDELDLTLVSGLDHGEYLIDAGSTPVSIESTVPMVAHEEHIGVYCFGSGLLSDGTGEIILHLTANYVSSNDPEKIVSIRWVIDLVYMGGYYTTMW